MEKNKKLSFIKSFVIHNHIRIASIVICLLMSVLSIYFSFYSYRSYREELIETEETQLLTMAETVGKSLVTYIEQELESLDLYFSVLESSAPPENLHMLHQAAEVFMTQNPELYNGMQCYGPDGRLLFQGGVSDFTSCILPDASSASICGKHLRTDGWYEMFLSKKFTWNSKIYTILYSIDLNEIYQQIVAPVQIGRGGYSIVKDSSLSIIMHHAKNQIGMDAVYDRSKQYPQLDLTDLASWIHLQKTQEEGYAVINSYIWDDPDLTPEKRIVAYTTIQLPGETWIVNSTLPYQELNVPLARMILHLATLSILFIAAMGIFVFVMTKSIMQAEGQKKEIAYLKEINEGMELIRHKEEEIQHYQRIQSIGQMSSHIAHEFNNYLTPVMVYGELLEKDEAISPENQELVKGILNAANQAAGLSRKLLDFSRQDSAVALTTINITEDVRKAADIIRQLTPESITYSAELPTENLFVRGRNGMIEHLLMNLCNNAFHAMEGTEGVLTIRLKENEDSEITLSVSDTGCGISKDALDKIFEPFYTTKRSGKGTGLGLSVVRNIMTAVNGRIHVDSQPGTGTTFSLSFAKTADPKLPSSVSPRKEIHKVVIVDDDPAILKSLSVMLKKQHFKTECYDHPAAVLSKIQNQKDYCDVILTDYSMPSMNGLEFAEIVRKLNPDIQLILMSGMTDSRFDWYLKNSFIDQFILKYDLADQLAGMLG